MLEAHPNLFVGDPARSAPPRPPNANALSVRASLAARDTLASANYERVPRTIPSLYVPRGGVTSLPLPRGPRTLTR